MQKRNLKYGIILTTGLLMTGVITETADAIGSRSFSRPSSSRSSSYSRPSSSSYKSNSSYNSSSSGSSSSSYKSKPTYSTTSPKSSSSSTSTTSRSSSNTSPDMTSPPPTKLQQPKITRNYKNLSPYNPLNNASNLSPKPSTSINFMPWYNNWMIYMMMFNTFNTTSQHQIIASEKPKNEPAYTITVKYNNKELVYVVSEEIYNQVQAGSVVHIENGNVTLK